MKFAKKTILTVALSTTAFASSTTPITTTTTTTTINEKDRMARDDFHAVRRQQQQHGNGTAVVPPPANTTSPMLPPPPPPSPITAPRKPSGYYTVVADDCGVYSSLVGVPGTMPFTFGFGSDIGFGSLTLPKPFYVFGDDPTTNLVLYADGVIRLDGIMDFDDGLGFFPLPIAVGNAGVKDESSIPRISFAQGDLVADVVNTLAKNNSFAISYDDAHFFGLGGSKTDKIQVQVELFYTTGDFHIRWGSVMATDDRIAVGIEDESRSAGPVAIPAVLGPIFEPTTGITVGRQAANMPQNSCLAFKVSNPPSAPSPPV
jgi:hypothetical protein